MRKHRILLLSHCLDYGGSERQLTEVARSMDREVFEMHVGCMISGGLREPELRAAGIPIVTFPMKSFHSLAAVWQSWRLASYIHRHRIDLVHAFDVPMDIFGAPTAKLSFGPVVLTSQRAHRSLTGSMRLRFLRATDHIADGIVVNCEYIRRHLIEDEHVPGYRIELCYNGLDANVFSFRERDLNPDRTVVIGCVCALRPEKNIELLIDAVGLLRRASVNCRLLIVGSGPDESSLQERVNELGLQDAVTFVPANSNIPEWLGQIDIFVLPSKTEALSNSLMEAMACGCAAIASDIGGNPELVGDDERGLLFREGNLEDLREQLIRLIQDPGLRAEKARAARAFVEAHLTLSASVGRMAEIYRHFLPGFNRE